jgi:hypothetical protein
MGYSKLINDKRFENYIKSKKKYNIIFALILSFIVIIGFYINGENNPDMNNPESLYIGLVISAIFISIGIYATIGINLTKTWDGVVIDKTKQKKKKDIGNPGEHLYKDVIEYKVIIKRNDNGKLYDIASYDDDTLYNYYNINDKVRHHKKLNSYEKYDKSKDTIIFCNACGSLEDIKSDTCSKCHCPLLK